MKSKMVVFGVAAIITGALGVPAVSHAITDVRTSGFSCVAINGTQASSLINAGNHSTGTVVVACPVPDVHNGVQEIGTVQVQLEDRSTVASPVASRCVNMVVANGGVFTACGPSQTAPAAVTGHLVFSPAAFASWTAPNFGYVSVSLPGRTVDLGRSTVQGIHAF